MKTVLCYGDSNTYGYIPGKEGARYPREIRWPGALQQMLGGAYYVVEEGLSGRTTVWDDPIEEEKNGKKYLVQCLESHKPIDLIILMLGTNDLKLRFGLSAYDISLGIETLVEKMQNPRYGAGGKQPEILVMAPAPVAEAPLSNALMGKEGIQKSRQLAACYQQVAQAKGTWFLDAGRYLEVSPADGLHYTPEGHASLARALAAKLGDILR